ncbi:MAG TPA: hypothetical protein VFN51_03140 [Candidatus Saccharimonadales bacterium]|nr:hypothetical protein [Candidatus Saccharimonadales bacterium]
MEKPDANDHASDTISNSINGFLNLGGKADLSVLYSYLFNADEQLALQWRRQAIEQYRDNNRFRQRSLSRELEAAIAQDRQTQIKLLSSILA